MNWKKNERGLENQSIEEFKLLYFLLVNKKKKRNETKNKYSKQYMKKMNGSYSIHSRTQKHTQNNQKKYYYYWIITIIKMKKKLPVLGFLRWEENWK